MISCLAIFILIGLFCLGATIYSYIKTKELSSSLMFFGIIFMIIGIIPLIPLLNGNESLSYKLAVIGVGVMFSGFAVDGVYNNIKCSLKVTAKYLKYNSYQGRNGVMYSPVFSYKYNNQEYENQTPQTFSIRYIQNNFKANNEYEVLINPKEPNVVLVKKQFPYLFTFLGLLFILSGFFL